MRQQHPQRDLSLLVYQLSIISQHLHLFQFWTQLVQLLVIVKVKLALLDQLHDSNCSDHLGATRNPEGRF
jgi:hypothetical protein